MSDRMYPDDPVDPFPEPPVRFDDREGRPIAVEASGADDLESLVEMYRAFDPADRAQGIPPIDEAAIRDWLAGLLDEDAINVVARHDGGIVGHAILVPDQNEAYELAVFVLGEFQGAGIGTRLLKGLLGQGQREGIEKVWLTVERWNKPAKNLYQKLGFETSNAESFELEMAIRLA